MRGWLQSGGSGQRVSVGESRGRGRGRVARHRAGKPGADYALPTAYLNQKSRQIFSDEINGERRLISDFPVYR